MTLKKYEQAESNFLKTLELKPNQKPVMALLYELYYRTRDYEQAEEVVKQLISFDVNLETDLESNSIDTQEAQSSKRTHLIKSLRKMLKASKTTLSLFICIKNKVIRTKRMKRL